MIPKHLRDESYRFCRIPNKGVIKKIKNPITDEWENKYDDDGEISKYNGKTPFAGYTYSSKEYSGKNVYPYNDTQMKRWVNDKNNYGVLAGFGGLYVVDIDSQESYEKLIDLVVESEGVSVELRKTLSQRSASWSEEKYWKKHFFFVDPKKRDAEIKTVRFSGLLDVQGYGAQVVGPGSSIDENFYSIEDNVNPTICGYREMLDAIKEVFPDVASDTVNKVYEEGQDWSIIEDSIVKQLHAIVCKHGLQNSMREVFQHYGSSLLNERWGCLLHPSQSRADVFIHRQNNGFYCHGCHAKGNVYDFIMMKEGVDLKGAIIKLLEIAGIAYKQDFDIVKLLFHNENYMDVLTVDEEGKEQGYKVFKKCVFERQGTKLTVLVGGFEKLEKSEIADSNKMKELFSLGIITKRQTTTGQIEFTLWADLLAKHLIELYHIKSTDGNSVYKYEDGIYVKQDNAWISKIGHDFIERLEYQRLFTPMKQREFEHFLFLKSGIEESKIEHSKRFIALSNCLLNIITYETQEYTPDLFVTNKLPYEYDVEAQCPEFESFLNSTFNSEEGVINYIQEIMGYCLIKEMPSKSLFYFLGGKDAGKSTLLTIVAAMIGEENTVSVPLERWADETYKAEFLNKMLNLCAETKNKNTRFDEASIKEISAGDLISARRKYGHPFSYRPYCKHIITGNEFPRFSDATGALMKRIYLVQFPNDFGSVGVEIKNYAKRIIDSDVSGIFNWAIDGLRKLRETDYEFTVPENIRLLKLTQEDEGNHLKEFLRGVLVKTHIESDRVLLNDLFKNDYKEWADEFLSDKGRIKSARSFYSGIRRMVIYGEVKRNTNTFFINEWVRQADVLEPSITDMI